MLYGRKLRFMLQIFQRANDQSEGRVRLIGNICVEPEPLIVQLLFLYKLFLFDFVDALGIRLFLIEIQDRKKQGGHEQRIDCLSLPDQPERRCNPDGDRIHPYSGGHYRRNLWLLQHGIGFEKIDPVPFPSM
jgi:hypothetical protein